METKHTPGPWRTEIGTIRGSYNVYEVKGNCVLATVYVLRNGETEANALLIASAPDLQSQVAAQKELIGELVEGLDRLKETYKYYRIPLTEYELIRIGQAEKLIKKAKQLK